MYLVSERNEQGTVSGVQIWTGVIVYVLHNSSAVRGPRAPR